MKKAALLALFPRLGIRPMDNLVAAFPESEKVFPEETSHCDYPEFTSSGVLDEVALD